MGSGSESKVPLYTYTYDFFYERLVPVAPVGLPVSCLYHDHESRSINTGMDSTAVLIKYSGVACLVYFDITRAVRTVRGVDYHAQCDII